MRKRFGDWGAELSDADFACALAAAGALWALQPPRGVTLKPALLASRLWLIRTPSGILPWRLNQPSPRFDARLLVEAWRSFLAFAGQEGFRIEIQASVLKLPWVLKQLSRPEVGAVSVEFSDQSPNSSDKTSEKSDQVPNSSDNLPNKSD